ncbi:MAG: family 1 glycosylhydrolase [Pararhizobium sp.]
MSPLPEVWGGVECSIVRISGTARNQLVDTGHHLRTGDLDLIAALGIRTLRYPVLWEMVEPAAGRYEWNWTDDRLRRLRDAGIGVNAGLIHHGSGPAWTHVLDPAFPELLAGYARRVARRYPWLDMFTPVNEPLTTARISGLYGLWHPHGRDEATFLRLLMAECRAIAEAMKAVREVTPTARLVQTEDFGRVFSTPRLEYQTRYENERRWLSVDLLSGRVDAGHPFHERLLSAGVTRPELAAFLAAPCPPDIIGIDHYLTSDRFLDERAERHPHEEIGGNGIDRYVDVAAVRSDVSEEQLGLLPRLEELWARYRLPIAVTELHNGCTREEQLRWLMEGWQAACTLVERGADIRAVTAWSLFGAVDWNSMLVRRDRYYECGAFDARFPTPRPTALAAAVRSLVDTRSFDHPVLDRPGWWRRGAPSGAGRRLLLAGFTPLISVVEECCARRRLDAVAVDPRDESGGLPTRHDAWALVRAEPRALGGSRSGSRAARLRCDFADGGTLTLEAPRSSDRHHVADAFLDLVVDGTRGALRLTQAGHANQYAFAEAADTAEDTAVPETA